MSAPTFKELVAADIHNSFLNSLEFAEQHTVNGKKMDVVIDDNELLERDKAKLMGAPMDGTYKSRRLLFVARADFGPRPAIGVMLELDGRQYRVKACTDEDGIFAMELERVKS